jgi:hypothetical protein
VAEYAPYLKYDSKLGILFVKAPSSKVNEVLEKIWSVSSQSGQMTVVYSIKILDLVDTQNMDRMLDKIAYNSETANREVVITPDQIQVKGDWETIFSMVDTYRKDLKDRQPWLAVLPGKTSTFTSVSHYVGDEPEEYQRFILALTPVSVDHLSGEIVTRVDLNGEENRKHSVSTTVRTRPGASEPLAVVRRPVVKKIHRWFGWTKTQEVRNYALILTAIPLNIQQYFVKDLSVMQVANLNGINLLSDPEAESTVSEQTSLEPQLIEMLLGLNGESGHLYPWFNMNYPLTDKTGISVNYEHSDLYELTYGWSPSSLFGTKFELRVGEGNGPGLRSAAMVGVSDQTKPVHKVSFFSKYYFAYLLDEEEFADSGYWELGSEYGEKPFRISASVCGGSDVDSYKLRLFFDVGRREWVFGVDHLEDTNYIKLGLSFDF